ncbi:major facilitator superfamily domain-containing protein [Xylariomycetidae sp. FL0641]|nr:major facilitator superfamily domain-containing protein [Xylariomycetidae sp. FL0641]
MGPTPTTAAIAGTTTTTSSSSVMAVAAAAAATATAAPPRRRRRRQLLRTLLGLSFAVLIVFAEQSGIFVLLPALAGDLAGAGDSISWAGTSAFIAATVAQVLHGRLSDIAGRKAVLLSCVAALVAGDLLCAAARRAPQLYVGRALAGVGNAGVANLANIILSDAVSLAERGRYQGIIGAAVGLGSVAGPFIAAGVIKGWCWQGLFWVNCLLGLAGGLVIQFTVPGSRVGSGNGHDDDSNGRTSGGSTTTTMTSSSSSSAVVGPRRLPGLRAKLGAVDWWGLLTSAAGLVLVLVPIASGGDEFRWDSGPAVGMLAAGGLLLGLFVLVEWRWAAMPLLPPRLFRRRAVLALLAQNVLLGAVYYANVYFLPVYYQTARGWSLMRAAVLTMPLVASQAGFSVAAGLLMSRTLRYRALIWAGFGVWLLGAGLMALLFDGATGAAAVAVVLAVEGAGVGMVFQPTLNALQALTAAEDRAVVTSARNFMRSIGGAVGLAMSTSLLSNQVMREIAPLPADMRRHIASDVMTIPDMSRYTPEQGQVVKHAYVAGCRAMFVSWVALQGLCFLLCIFIEEVGLGGPPEHRDHDNGWRMSQLRSPDPEVGGVVRPDLDSGADPSRDRTGKVAGGGLAMSIKPARPLKPAGEMRVAEKS